MSGSTMQPGRSHDVLGDRGRHARRDLRLPAGGLSLHRELPPFWLRFLHFVPIAVFAALVTPSLTGERGEGGIRLAAAALTALTAWRWKNLGLALGVGLVAFWLLRVPF